MSDAALAWQQYRLERRMFWRNPTAAFFNFFLPLLFLALFGAIFSGSQADLDVIVPGIAGMSIMATTFSALVMGVTFLREEGVLKRVRGTPLPTGGYLAAIGANAVTNAVLQVAIIVLAGRLFFGVGWPKDWLELVVFVVAGVACLASLGVAWSHVVPNFDAAAAYQNIVFLPTIFISGVFFDNDHAPAFLRDIAQALPLVHIIDGLSGALVTGRGLADNLSALAVIGLWTVLGVTYAIRGFSWESRRAELPGDLDRHGRGPLVAQQAVEVHVVEAVGVAVPAPQRALAREAELLQRPLRAGVLDVGVGADALEPERLEGQVQHERLALGVDAGPPVGAPQPGADHGAAVAHERSTSSVMPQTSSPRRIASTSASPDSRRPTVSSTNARGSSSLV